MIVTKEYAAELAEKLGAVADKAVPAKMKELVTVATTHEVDPKSGVIKVISTFTDAVYHDALTKAVNGLLRQAKAGTLGVEVEEPPAKVVKPAVKAAAAKEVAAPAGKTKPTQFAKDMVAALKDWDIVDFNSAAVASMIASGDTSELRKPIIEALKAYEIANRSALIKETRENELDMFWTFAAMNALQLGDEDKALRKELKPAKALESVVEYLASLEDPADDTDPDADDTDPDADPDADDTDPDADDTDPDADGDDDGDGDDTSSDATDDNDDNDW